MRIVLFYHSLISDWNHGNAHFLRGVAGELQDRGHDVQVYEPRDSWSVENLLRDHGETSILRFHSAYPRLRSRRYELSSLDLDQALEGARLAIVHEWNAPGLIQRIGEHRKKHGNYLLLFHDTHHRSVTNPQELASYDLSAYDAVLAFGNLIRDLYLERGWAKHAWTWHEAADSRIAHPLPETPKQGDLVWIGNWGDEERSQELRTFLLEPVAALRLRARVRGVRYPGHARHALRAAGIQYRGWIPNFEVPREFASFHLTIHVPRRPYATQLPGIPTIRPFEAMSCGIPLISSPWEDTENLFTAGRDYLVAHDGEEMRAHLSDLLAHPSKAATLAANGRRTILAKHTCAHRVDQLMTICGELGMPWPCGPSVSS